MKNYPIVIAIILSILLIALVPSSCQKEEKINRLAKEQEAALERGDLKTARSLNEDIESLTKGKHEPPIDAE